jgi:V-type H+-transporting ATPase subunit H
MTTKVAPIPPPFFSPYLDDQCNKINSKPVPWEVSRLAQRCTIKGSHRTNPQYELSS